LEPGVLQQSIPEYLLCNCFHADPPTCNINTLGLEANVLDFKKSKLEMK
jgi:hypothetical protein